MKTSPVRTIISINTKTAIDIANSAIEEGLKQGVSISVAVCDPLMNLIVFIKSDGATPHSTETSRRKAQTASSTGKATGWMPGNLAVTLPLASNNLLTNIPGGIPIFYEDKLIGAIGVAGGSIEQDQSIAEAALKIIEGNE
jgi:uncharacterized protein GlcG (DUF336 family)